jgi:alpha-D-ribose 1-methylphosphonate 5-triphosphate synthase subunit PhnI
MAHIERIMREGTGADRQLAAFAVRGQTQDVVDQIVAETYQGLELPEIVGAGSADPPGRRSHLLSRPG